MTEEERRVKKNLVQNIQHKKQEAGGWQCRVSVLMTVLEGAKAISVIPPSHE